MSEFLARLCGNYALFLETMRGKYDLAEKFYRLALRHAPEDPALLGDYADFLENVRADYDEAEACYRRACAAGPGHVNNLTNYATFLTEIRQEHRRAEDLYERALALCPSHRNTLFKYAIFLTDIRHDYERAEALYQHGLEVAPGNLAMLANYTGLLLMQGKEAEGLRALEAAIRHPSMQNPSADAAELWFYTLVYSQPASYGEALAHLKTLLDDQGARSPGWNLAPHLARARERGHLYSEWLDLLAAVIVDDAPIDVLRWWDAWREAEPNR